MNGRRFGSFGDWAQAIVEPVTLVFIAQTPQLTTQATHLTVVFADYAECGCMNV